MSKGGNRLISAGKGLMQTDDVFGPVARFGDDLLVALKSALGGGKVKPNLTPTSAQISAGEHLTGNATNASGGLIQALKDVLSRGQ